MIETANLILGDPYVVSKHNMLYLEEDDRVFTGVGHEQGPEVRAAGRQYKFVRLENMNVVVVVHHVPIIAIGSLLI